MNDITQYAILIGAALAFALANMVVNVKSTKTATKFPTMICIWAGLGLALATLIKLTTEVWS